MATTYTPSSHQTTQRTLSTRLLDRAAAFDPGWNRLRFAIMVVAVVLAVTGVEWLFVGQTHALQVDTHGASLPAAEAAKIGFANHAAIVAASLTGASAGLLSLVAMVDPRPRQAATTLAIVCVGLVGGLTFGLGVDRHHTTVGLVSIVVALTIGGWLRRFGPIGFAFGMALFVGVFSGKQSSGHEGLGDLGWICAELGIGLATALVVLTLLRPRPARVLKQAEHGYTARANRALVVVQDLLEHGPTPVRRRRVSRALTRMNEAAVMIDGQLAKPGALKDGRSARRLHERLLAVEVAVTNAVRAASELAVGPAEERQLALSALRALSAGELDRARGVVSSWAGTTEAPHASADRFAFAVLELIDALAAWLDLEPEVEQDSAAFTPAPPLVGSAVVSAKASSQPAAAGFRGWDRVRLAPATRTAIQLAVASSAALAVGYAVSSSRWYWAIIAVFISFIGTNNAGEQAGKAVWRVAGTAVGLLVGSLLAHAVGHGHWHVSFVVLLLGLFWAFYFQQINYGIAVIGIVVMASQIYVQFGEFSDSLLDTRLKETAIGAAAAVLTVAFVVPLRSRRVLATSLDEHRAALADVTDWARANLDGVEPDGDATLTERMRALDSAYQNLIVTARAARVSVHRSGPVDPSEVVEVATTTHLDTRQLVAAVQAGHAEQAKSDLTAIDRTLARVQLAG